MADDARTAAPDEDAPAPAADTTPAATTAGEPVMAVRVTADRLLVSTGDGGEKRSRGGILIPATAESRDRMGVWADVREVGPLVRSAGTGDKVLFLPDSAIQVDIHGEQYLIVRERDIHAIASADEDVRGTGLYL